MSESPQRHFKGIWIPASIWEHPDLSFFEKCLAAEIDSLDGDEGCFASNEYFEKFFGLKKRWIQNGLAKLKKLGIIQEISFDGRTRFLRGYSKINANAHQTCSDNAHQQCRKMHPPHAEKCTPPVKPYIYDNKAYIKDNIPSDAQAHHNAQPSASLVDKFLFSIKKKKPDFKDPDKAKWAKDFDKMLNQDGRSERDIIQVIEWVVSSQFWFKHILSPKKLREKFDQLQLAMREDALNFHFNKNVAFFERLKLRYPMELDYAIRSGNFLKNKKNQKDISLKMNHEAFLRIFSEIMEVELEAEDFQ